MSNNPEAQSYSFQAEVRQLLDIVVNSLYTDREIFVRELVSNASDSLEKLRHLQITEKDVFDESLPLEINLTCDENAGTVTIQDFGVGMTREELVENLGTIAHSGSKAFLKAIGESGQTNANLIGRFGVGFYSVFMVAKRVRVFSRSWNPKGKGYCWSSDGQGRYEIEEVEGQRRGCKIVIELRDDQKEFAKTWRVKQILERYSRFVQFPIHLDGEQTNKMQALWLRNKNEIKEEEYIEFYRFAANTSDAPRYRLHFSADAPLALNALLYVPRNSPEIQGLGRVDPGVALHCRKILIDSHPKELLPEWLRFLKGVIDSEDLPLNISRETMQDSALVKKLNTVISKRFLKFLVEEAAQNPGEYESFFKEFGFFLKEGAATDFTHRETLAKLVRFESSLTEPGKCTSLSDYVSRMKEGQKEIYYLVAPSRQAIESGPYLEAFRARNLEVLHLLEPVDEFVVSSLREFEGKQFSAADQDDLTLEDAPLPEGESLGEEEVKSLCLWMRGVLGDRVGEVGSGKRLVESPALVLNADKMMSMMMRRMMKAMHQEDGEKGKVNLEINPRHQLIRNIASLRSSNEELARLVAEQVFDNAMVAAGLMEDPREMVNRINRILEAASGNRP